MGMIAEMHISSPPAALDYQGLKSSGAIFPESLKTFGAAVGDAPSNRDNVRTGLSFVWRQSFHGVCGRLCFAGKGKVLKI